jgi:hypothetical protein
MSNRSWAVQQCPMLLVWTGLALFGLAGIYCGRLPVEAIFVGPAMMVAGVAMKEVNKRESRGQQDGGSGDNASHSNAG